MKKSSVTFTNTETRGRDCAHTPYFTTALDTFFSLVEVVEKNLEPTDQQVLIWKIEEEQWEQGGRKGNTIIAHVELVKKSRDEGSLPKVIKTFGGVCLEEDGSLFFHFGSGATMTVEKVALIIVESLLDKK